MKKDKNNMALSWLCSVELAFLTTLKKCSCLYMEPIYEKKPLGVIMTIKMYLNISGSGVGGGMDFYCCWQCEQQKPDSLTNLLEKACVLIKDQMVAI